MCRILLSTATNVPASVGMSLFDRAMLYMQDDGGNTDGYGVVTSFEPVHTYKTTIRYSLQNPKWMVNYEGGPLLAHLRNATIGTELSPAATHPFHFHGVDRDNKDLSIVAVHNGAFPATKAMTFENAPNSDSWKAFATLFLMLKARGIGALDSSLIEEWLDEVALGGAFAVVFYIGGSFYLFRNTQRFLYVMPFENGLLINTSQDVLKMAGAYAEMRWGIENLSSKLLLLPDKVLYRINPGDGTDVEVFTLNFPISAAPTKTTYGWGSEEYDDYDQYRATSYKGNRATGEVRTTQSTFPDQRTNPVGTPITTAIQVVEKAKESNATAKTVEPAITIHTDLTKGEVSGRHTDWWKLFTMLTPLSSFLILKWMESHFQGAFKEWHEYTPEEIKQFSTFLIQRRALKWSKNAAKYKRHDDILSMEETDILSIWNTMVYQSKHTESKLYDDLFGSGTSFFLELSNVKESLGEFIVRS